MPEAGIDSGLGRLVSKFKAVLGRKPIESSHSLPLTSLPQLAEQPLVQTQKEIPKRAVNLGILFQQSVSSLPESNLPPLLESGGASAILSTNEDISDTLPVEVANSNSHPDGYIFGAGFGNILSLVSLYPRDTLPRAILATDIMPDVIIFGRMFTDLLARSNDFNQLYSSLRNGQSLKDVYDKVIQAEGNLQVRDRLQNIPFDAIHAEINKILGKEHIPADGIKQKGKYQRVIVLAAIRDNFELLNQLAKEGNIGIAYGDMTNPSVLDVVNKMPEFQSSRNVIYMSNVIDHLTHRGTDITNLHAMDILGKLGSGEERGNWYIDTTQNSLDYKLRATHQLPQYTMQDVRGY